MRKLKIEKKYIPFILMAIACIVVAILCAVRAVDEIKYNECLTDSSFINLEQTLLIADGGNGTEIPKNTTYSVDDLRTKQFSAIKIDARLTKDKKWVSLQDDDISCVTKGEGSVKNFNYYDLLNYNIDGIRKSEIPIIELVSKTAKYAYENSVAPVIYFHDYSKSATKKLLGTLEENGVYVLSFASDDIRVLEYIRKLNKDVNLIYYVETVTDESIQKCKVDGNMSLCFDAEKEKNVDTLIERLVTENVSFVCRNTETLSDIELLYKKGVRRFITDTVAVDL